MLIRSIGSIWTATFKGICVDPVRFYQVGSRPRSLSRQRPSRAKDKTPIRSCDLCAESINDVTRHFAGGNHDDVEADTAIGILRMPREPQFGCAGDAGLGPV